MFGKRYSPAVLRWTANTGWIIESKSFLTTTSLTDTFCFASRTQEIFLKKSGKPWVALLPMRETVHKLEEAGSIMGGRRLIRPLSWIWIAHKISSLKAVCIVKNNAKNKSRISKQSITVTDEAFNSHVLRPNHVPNRFRDACNTRPGRFS